MDEVDKLLEIYAHTIKDELSKNLEYLETEPSGRSLAGELAKLHEDWSNLQTIVASTSKDLKMDWRSMVEWYVESMLFITLSSLTKMVLLGLIDSCFQLLRGLIEGIKLALGLDTHPEYRNLNVDQKISIPSSERNKITQYVSDRLLNENEKKTLKDSYRTLSEDWIHAPGYFKRGIHEFKETGEIPSWQLYPTCLDERNKEVDKLADYIKRYRELLNAIINKWQLLLKE